MTMTRELLALKIHNKLYWCRLLTALFTVVTSFAAIADNIITTKFSNKLLPPDVMKVKKVIPAEIRYEDKYDLQRKVDNIKEKIGIFCNSNGYYNFEIKTKLMAPNLHFVLTINSKKIKIVHLSQKIIGYGSNDTNLNNDIALLWLSGGFTHSKYENYKQELINTCQSHGYFAAKFARNVVKIDKQANSATIALEVDTGVKYKINKISLSGSKYPNSKLLEIISIKAHDNYIPKAIKKIYTELNTSNILQEVSIVPSFNHDKHEVDIDIKVRDKKKQQFKVNFGVSKKEKFFIGGKYTRALNQPGQNISLGGEYSKTTKGILVNYRYPGKEWNKEYYDLGYELKKIDEDGKNSLSNNFDVVSLKKINFFNRKNQIKYGLNYVYEDSILFGKNKFSSKLLMPVLQINSNKTKSHPTGFIGNKIELITKFSRQEILSTINLFQYEIDYQHAFYLSHKSRLIFGVNFGQSITNDISKLPLSFRYYLGGSNSVRGYACDSIGPFECDESHTYQVNTGAKNKLVLSVELDRVLYKQISGAVFIDMGDAKNDFNFKMHRSIGIGIRYNLGFAQLGIDLATPLDSDSYTPKLHLNFNLGG